jgi:hypothetical protein
MKTNVGEAARKKEPSYTAGGNVSKYMSYVKHLRLL